MTDIDVLLDRLELLNKLNRNLSSSLNNQECLNAINVNNELINQTRQELISAGLYIQGGF